MELSITLVCGALAAALLLLALAVPVAALLRRGVRARGGIQLPGVACHGEFEVDSEK